MPVQTTVRDGMTQYIIRRVLLSLITLFGIIAIVFVIARLLPGDPCLSALGERATDAICNDFNERFGLNEPILRPVRPLHPAALHRRPR